jgi:hypothetical protein
MLVSDIPSLLNTVRTVQEYTERALCVIIVSEKDIDYMDCIKATAISDIKGKSAYAILIDTDFPASDSLLISAGRATAVSICECNKLKLNVVPEPGIYSLTI